MIPFWVESTLQVQIRTKSGHLIWVHPIHGLPKSILVHPKSHRFYESYWEEGDEPGDPKTREWRCYADIWSLHRGLELARIRAIKQRLPLLQELYDQCARSVACLLGTDHRRPETLAEVAAFAAQFLDAIRMPQTHALRAARAHVEQVASLHDSRGRHNPRALAARLVATGDTHLRQRTADLIGWLGHYAHWADDVGRLQELAGGFLSCLTEHIDYWHLVVAARDPTWMSRPQPTLHQAERGLVHLVAFGGWSMWARECLHDLRQVHAADRRGDRTAGKLVCDRLRQAVGCKQLHAKLSQLLLDIEVDRLSDSFEPRVYRGRLAAMEREVSGLDDRLLRRPVRPQLLKQLTAARTAFDGNGEQRTRLRTTRNHLRAACNAL